MAEAHVDLAILVARRKHELHVWAVHTKLGPSPPFGARMPIGNQPPDDAMLACVLDWIDRQQGAPQICVADAGVE
jgi:hypothetical protein